MLILHHYWPSPFAHKIRMALGLANFDWMSVEIPRVPPKPLLTPLTAGYRRTPVLQIGADIYCDTQNIARALAEQGASARLFPQASQASALLVSDWVDQQLFPLAARVVITSALETAPPEFVKDRGDLYFGAGWSIEQLQQDFAGVLMQLRAGLSRLDGSLATRMIDSSADLGYADVAVAYLCWFIRGRWDQGPALLSQFPHLCRVEEAVCAVGHGNETTLDAEDALQIAANSAPVSAIGVDQGTGFVVGQAVSIRPFITSSDPEVQGTLRYLDATRVSIDVCDPRVGDIAVHFPVFGYQMTAR